jgi:hypothetical protein
LRTFALRLCNTDPSEIFDEYAWNAHSIKSRQDTIAWVAARKFLGDVWHSKAFDVSKEAEDMEIDKDDNAHDETDDAKVVTPAKSVNWVTVGNKQKEKGKEKDDKESEKQQESRSTPAANKFFLSKAIRKTNYDSNLGNTAYTRKHKFYIKTKLPKVTNKDDAEAEAEVVKAFSAMLQRFLHLDSAQLSYRGMTENMSNRSPKANHFQKQETRWNTMLIESLFNTTKLHTVGSECRSMLMKTDSSETPTGFLEEDAGTKRTSCR